MANRTDFNPEQIADIDLALPADTARDATQADASKETVRRAIRELEMVRDNLSEPDRSALGERIDSIQSMLTSGVNPATIMNTMVVTARSEATTYAGNEAARTQSMVMDGVADLSAASQARVLARISAITRADAAEYYFESYDPEGQLNTAARTHIAKLIEADPDLQEQAQRAARAPEKALIKAEAGMARDNEWLKERIRQYDDPQMKAMLSQVDTLNLLRDAGDSKKLHAAIDSGDVQAISSAVAEAIHHRMEIAGEKLEAMAREPQHAALFRNLCSNKELLGADGYSLDPKKLIEYYANHREEIRAALNMHGQKLTPEQMQMAAVGNAMALVNTDHTYVTQKVRMLEQVAKEKPIELSLAFDSSLPMVEREVTLTAALKAQGAKGSDAAILKDAQHYITFVDQHPEAKQAIMGGKAADFGAAYKQYRQDHKLKAMGYDDAQIEILNSYASQSSEMAMELKRAVRSQNEDIGQQKLLLDNILSGGPAEHKDTLSILQYYNLDKTLEGATLQANIYNGAINADEGRQAITAMQQDTIRRMAPYRELVTARMSNEYRARLENIPGMLDANGDPNIENLMELARHNRDALSLNTAQDVKAKTGQEWDALSDAQKDARAVARTVSLFKAVDLIRNFGGELTLAMDRPGEKGAQFFRDLELYETLTNTYGTIAPEKQRQAIEDFLKKDLYYANNEDVRKELTDFVMAVTDNPRTQQLLTDTRNLENRDGSISAPKANTNVIIDTGQGVVPEVVEADASQQALQAAVKAALAGLSTKVLMDKFSAVTSDPAKLTPEAIAAAAVKAVEHVGQLDSDHNGSVTLDEISASAIRAQGLPAAEKTNAR